MSNCSHPSKVNQLRSEERLLLGHEGMGLSRLRVRSVRRPSLLGCGLLPLGLTVGGRGDSSSSGLAVYLLATDGPGNVYAGGSRGEAGIVGWECLGDSEYGDLGFGAGEVGVLVWSNW